MKKRVRHVITEIARVNSFVRAFANGKIDEAGRLFNASHDSLAADYEVTVPSWILPWTWPVPTVRMVRV